MLPHFFPAKKVKCWTRPIAEEGGRGRDGGEWWQSQGFDWAEVRNWAEVRRVRKRGTTFTQTPSQPALDNFNCVFFMKNYWTNRKAYVDENAIRNYMKSYQIWATAQCYTYIVQVALEPCDVQYYWGKILPNYLANWASCLYSARTCLALPNTAYLPSTLTFTCTCWGPLVKSPIALTRWAQKWVGHEKRKIDIIKMSHFPKLLGVLFFHSIKA